MWAEFVNGNGVELAGSTPYFIVARSPEAQKSFQLYGGLLWKASEGHQTTQSIEPDWRQKSFAIEDTGTDETVDLLMIGDDLSYDIIQEGVTVSGLTEVLRVRHCRRGGPKSYISGR